MRKGGGEGEQLLLFGYNVCFLFSNKKRPPNNQPGAAGRKTAPENFPWEEFQKLPRLERAPLCWLRASDGHRRPRLASPRTPAILRIREAPDLGSVPGTLYRCELQDGENTWNLRRRGNSLLQTRECTSILPLQRAPGPPQLLLPLLHPHASPPGPLPAQWSPPRLLTTPPAHLHLPPVPRHPDIRVGVPPPGSPSSRPHCLCGSECRKPTGSSVRSATRGRGTWRAGRDWGGGQGPPSGRDRGRRRRRGARLGQRRDFSRSLQVRPRDSEVTVSATT